MAEPKPFCSQPNETKQKGDSLATDIDRMILAARQIGEVVGEDLLGDIRLDGDVVYLRCLSPEREQIRARLTDADALDLLTARVWRAVQKWAVAGGGGAAWYATDWVDFIHTPWMDSKGVTDLPSAVAAIHKHWEENR